MVSSYLDQFLIIYYIPGITLFSCIDVKYATSRYLEHKNLGIHKYEISSIITLASFKCHLYLRFGTKTRTLSVLSVCVPGSNLYIHTPRYKQSVVQLQSHRQMVCHMKYFNYLIKIIINIVKKWEIQ